MWSHLPQTSLIDVNLFMMTQTDVIKQHLQKQFGNFVSSTENEWEIL